ncbi:MAG: hypothetical protein KGZ43_01920 [Sulfuritalea sp.]|nr:hypothetical protein [Sulfuritalea sp.]
MNQFKHAALALAMAGLLSAQAQASEAQVQKLQAAQPVAAFSQTDIDALFEQADKPMQLAALSQQEMKETDGAALWFAPIVFHAGRYAAVRIAHHSAHHTFGSLGRLPHIQFNAWRPGVSGSGGAFRIPLPNTPFFRP